jgi:hypothetical protein
VKKPLYQTRRNCPECSGILEPGERTCPCVGREFRTVKAYPADLTASHFHHLMKTIRSGSWASTGYKAPRNPAKEAEARLYQDFGPASGFTVSRRRREYHSFRDVQWFIYRAELAHSYWRDEFAGLMATRLTIWLGGCTKQKTCDFLQIPRASLKWLDSEIRKFVRFPGRARSQNSEFLESRRKMKAGVALDIIRRRQKGYKQTQVLQPQRVDPFSEPKPAISEGGSTPSTERIPCLQ